MIQHQAKTEGEEALSSATEMDKMKNELYQYLSKMESKINKNLFSFEEKQTESLNQFQKQLDENTLKSTCLNDIVIQQKIRIEKIDELEIFRRKGEDQLISHEIRLNNLRKEFDRAIAKYDRMYIDNLIVPGYVGDCAQFKNMREYVDHNIGQVSNLFTAKEKMSIDLKEIKSRHEGIMRMFTSQVENYNKNHYDYISKKHSETKDYIADQMKIINDEFVELRMTNCKYAIDLKNKAAELNIEWEKMNNIKDEIYETFNARVEEFKLEEKKTHLNVFNMTNELKNIKIKFNELVQFIKDVRFRKNLEKYEGVSKKSIKEVSKKIEFSKLKKAKSIDIGSLFNNSCSGNSNTNQSNAQEVDVSIDYSYDYYTGESKPDNNSSITKTRYSTQETQATKVVVNQHKRTHSEPKYTIEEEIIVERSPEEEETKKSFMPQQQQAQSMLEDTEEKEKPESVFFKKHPNLLKGQNKSKNVKIVFTEFKEGTEKKHANDNNNLSEVNRSTKEKCFQSPNPSTKRSHKLLNRPDALKLVELSFDQQTIQPTHLLDFSNKDHWHHLQLKPIDIQQRGSKKFKTIKESPQKMKTCFGSLVPSSIRKVQTNGKDNIDCSQKQNLQLPNLVLRNYYPKEA